VAGLAGARAGKDGMEIATRPTATAGEGPERLLHGLNEAQREAAEQTSGPLVILAGAGTGKTRVISHRAAYAVETGVVAADRILLVTFTDKAASEMVGRMAALGQPRVMARTFHAHALRQLRHFWPDRHADQPPPQIVDSKLPLLGPLASRLPGGYRWTTVRDLADAIEWAKVRRIPPERWEQEGGDRAPIPADLFARLYRDYERQKERTGRIDFEDMLALTVELLESDAEAAKLVQRQKTWISVDEYQDTNPLQERLLELWTGDSADLAVVGDPDQTIYTFTGATPEFLLRFAERHPGARTVALTENYRSTPQVLELANRLTRGGPREPLRPTRTAGPTPTISRLPGEDAELAAVVERIRKLLAEGVAGSDMAVLVRINAQLPAVENALTRARIEFTVRGQRFYDRQEIRQARQLLRGLRLSESGPALVQAVAKVFAERLGFDPAAEGAGAEARERTASLQLMLDILSDLAQADEHAGLAEFLAELDRRAAAESATQGKGVNLLTYHRSKGLEWDAVFLPAVEEALLPIRQAKTDEAVAEERRLLYVGITRARTHLALSWTRKGSRFLADLTPPRPATAAVRTPAEPLAASIVAGSDGPMLERLQLWRRERARRDGVPAYVIAHDATLRAIADSRPRSMGELHGIKGMGPVKLEQYGADILAIVAQDADAGGPPSV
jgi:DNA helicase-2/ATP-dependent DNA helicase PcrA